MTSSAADPVVDAERLLSELGAHLTDPRDTECLYHYLLRMLDAGRRSTRRRGLLCPEALAALESADAQRW